MSQDQIQAFKARKEVIESRISDLIRQRDELEAHIRQLVAEKLMAGGNVKITRRNRQKIYIYGLVRQVLGEEKVKGNASGLKAKYLFEKISKNDDQLRYNTFRSYLHRLKKERKIVHNQLSHTWSIPESD